jgi:hypothetical protein
VRLLDACTFHATKHGRVKRRWGVPSLFFFDPAAQAELQAQRTEDSPFPQPQRAALRGKFPRENLSWEQLSDALDDALTLIQTVQARRIARAQPQLIEQLHRLAPYFSGADELAGVLDIPDDMTVLAIHPQDGYAVRVQLCGVATVEQFHERLTVALADYGLMAPTAKPSGLGTEFVPQFQLYKMTALQPDGRLPDDARGCVHWVYPEAKLSSFSLVDGEAIVLLGKPIAKAAWRPERRFAQVDGTMSVVNVWNSDQVQLWLRRHCPNYHTLTTVAKPRLLQHIRAA